MTYIIFLQISFCILSSVLILEAFTVSISLLRFVILNLLVREVQIKDDEFNVLPFAL